MNKSLPGEENRLNKKDHKEFSNANQGGDSLNTNYYYILLFPIM